MLHRVIALLGLFCLSFIPVSETNLSITVVGIKTDIKGFLRVGIFKKEGFGDATKAIAGEIINVTGATMKIDFTTIPPGTYAVIIVQDQDKNGKLNKNFLGVPTEPYAFSNNKYGLMGLPDFEDVSFELEIGKKKQLQIKLND